MHPCPMFPRVCGRGETYLEPGAALLQCHADGGTVDSRPPQYWHWYCHGMTQYSEKAASPYLLLKTQSITSALRDTECILSLLNIMLGCPSVNLHWSLQTSALILYGDNLNSVFIITVCIQHLVFEQQSYCNRELSCLLPVIGWTGSH